MKTFQIYVNAFLPRKRFADGITWIGGWCERTGGQGMGEDKWYICILHHCLSSCSLLNRIFKSVTPKRETWKNVEEVF